MAEKKQKKWRKILWTLVFVAINIVVIAVTAVNEFGNSQNAAELSDTHINWWYMVPAAGLFGLALFFNIYKYALMIRRMSDNTISWGQAFKLARRTVILGRYYDNITPAAVGGQPVQMYYMRKNSGLKKGVATAIPIFGMIAIQISFIAIALVCFAFAMIRHDNSTLMVTAWLGLLFYAFWPVMVAMANFFPKATSGIIKWGVKVLAKIHIVKDREKALDAAEKEVAEYVQAVKLIMKKRGLFAKTLFIALLHNICVASIPFFVLTTFGGTVGYLNSFALTVAVMAAVYFIPTPGNSGAAEGTFYVVFSALSAGYVFWAMLFWRFFSYYIYIIMGLITYAVMHVEKKYKERHDTR